MMNWLTAILTTIGMVGAAVCLSAVVVVTAWLIGNYGFDRILQIASPMMTVAAFLSLLTLYIRPKRQRIPRCVERR